MIDDYMVRLGRALDDLPADQRRAVLDEVHSHLVDQARELQASGMDRDAAETEAIRRFGEPTEIAAGYDADTGEVKRNGEVMLRVANAAGRGAKVAAIGVGKGLWGLGRLLAVVVVTALVVAGTIAVAAIVFADDWAPYIEDAVDRNVEHPVYHSALDDIQNTTFYVPESAASMRVAWATGSGGGCTDVALIDPAGDTVHERQICDGDHGRTTLPPTPGTWRIEATGTGDPDGWIEVSYRKS